MALLVPGYKAIHAIADALGLAGQRVKRLVIELDIDNVATVHITRLVTREEVAALARAVEGHRPDIAVEESLVAGVSRDGFVVYEPVEGSPP